MIVLIVLIVIVFMNMRFLCVCMRARVDRVFCFDYFFPALSLSLLEIARFCESDSVIPTVF